MIIPALSPETFAERRRICAELGFGSAMTESDAYWTLSVPSTIDQIAAAWNALGLTFELCAGGHTYDESGNTICHIETADQPCGTFVSAGYGPEGDFEHSVFCASCGWEYGDHCDEDDE